MKAQIAVIRGDGIGSEIIEAALKVLFKINELYKHEFSFKEALMGGVAIDTCGFSLPDETLKLCKSSQAVLFGAIGGAKWDNEPKHNRPESALLRLRKELNLFANLRPARLFKALENSSPLKNELLEKGIDFIIVRELISGIYFGEHSRREEKDEIIARDVLEYSSKEILNIGRVGFELAMKRKKKLLCVDKANVLESSRLWREVLLKLSKEYKEVELSFMYVDNAAMQLCKNPAQFDVIVTENMFGDILSDEASVLTGSLGVLPSASLRDDKFGLYEPIHGSAPDIAGKDIANPIGTILSAALMLDMSFDLKKEARAIERAVESVLNEGYRTADIMSEGCEQVGCAKMSELICKALEEL